jgi:hypothetical protein
MVSLQVYYINWHTFKNHSFQFGADDQVCFSLPITLVSETSVLYTSASYKIHGLSVCVYSTHAQLLNLIAINVFLFLQNKCKNKNSFFTLSHNDLTVNN